MAEKEKTPIIRKTSSGKTCRCGFAKVVSVKEENMVRLSDNVMTHLKLKVGDTVSYVPTEDGNVVIKKAQRTSRKRHVGGGNVNGRGRAGGSF